MKKPIPCCTSSCLTLEPALGGSDEPARACLTNLLNAWLSSDGHRKEKGKQEGPHSPAFLSGAQSSSQDSSHDAGSAQILHLH